MAPVLTPLAKGEHDGEQSGTLGSEGINDLAAVIRITASLENSATDQFPSRFDNMLRAIPSPT